MAHYDTRKWWARRDSNPRQHRYERRVLTTELRARPNLEVIAGLRPVGNGLVAMGTDPSVAYPADPP